MAKKSSESIVDKFIKDARSYAISRQQLEEAQRTGRLTAREAYQIKLMQPIARKSDREDAQDTR